MTAASTSPDLHVNNIRFAAVLTAVSCSRAFVRHTLGHWNLADHVETATLVMSELVTNAVKSTGLLAPQPKWTDIKAHHIIGVQLRTLGPSLYVEVWDRSREAPVPQAPTLDAEGGRGLLLVETMSERWGISQPSAGGKIVWAELAMSKPLDPISGRPHLPRRVTSTVRPPAGGYRSIATEALLQQLLEGLQQMDERQQA